MSLGLFQVATSFGLRKAGQRSWIWALTSGIVTSALGLYFLIIPDTGAALITVLVGVFAVLAGAVLIFGAIQLLRSRTSPELRY